ncbi:MAG: signal peptidase II [Bacilli bacterium]|jgi:signal peptidase II|nr:signal peptidase II [Bacilli bacterium]
MEGKTDRTAKKRAKMEWKGFLGFGSYAWMALLLFAIDIATKWVVQTTLKTDTLVYTDGIRMIDGFWYVVLSHNTFAAFGNWFNIDASNEALVIGVRIVLILISWLMSAVIIWYWGTRLSKKDKLMNAIMALLFAGAVGNLIDRTFYWKATVGFDGVIDFMCFYLLGTDRAPFAIFNVADSCLTIGIVMLIVTILVRDVRKGNKETAEEQRKEQLGDEPKDPENR